MNCFIQELRLFALITCLCLPFSVFIAAVSLQAHNAPKQRSIDLSITWNGPTELLHGIFQGYEIFYRDMNLGKEFNVTLRTSDTFYEIRDLQHYTKYMITARSFTLEGEGRMSEPIYVWTATTGNFSITHQYFHSFMTGKA